MTRMAMPAVANASTGAMSAGTMTFDSSPSPSTALVPAAAMVLPTRTPISACDELDGRPKYQVIRFQAIAPTRPAKTIVIVMSSALTIPLATVAATFRERNAPTKLRIEAKVTATRGGTACVEIAVATTLAVSWKPFVKSKASAVATTMTRMTSESMASGVLDDDALEHVGDALACVDRILDALEDVLPADDHHRVDPALEQRGNRLTHDPIAVVLQAVDLDRVVVDVAEVAHPRHRLGDLARRLQQDVRHPLGLLHRRLDLVEAEVVGDFLGQIDDVVERTGQLEDVLAVDRRDEGVVQALDHVVGDPVALLLADQDVAREVSALGIGAQHLVEQVGRPDSVRGGLLEEVEELAVLRDEHLRKSGHGRHRGGSGGGDCEKYVNAVGGVASGHMAVVGARAEAARRGLPQDEVNFATWS